MKYLYGRGLDLDFIREFQLGLAPKTSGMLRKILHAKYIKDEIMVEAGLIQPGNEGGWRDFFHDRITVPIRDASGAVIGFSARKYKDETYGGKYVNTSETPLFKKSKILFGLNYCRRRIAKERKAIIVEGQIDALRLIQAGFNITVAGQGTAFGESHSLELVNLGINKVYLALDSDPAGQEATNKIGNLFQKKGVEVLIVKMPKGADPDSFLRENSPDEFVKLLESSIDFLTFLVQHESQKINIQSPAGKNELVRKIVQKIHEWDQPLMVHESLRKVAHLLQIPENMVGINQIHTPNIYIKKSASAGVEEINPDCILETDFLRWLYLLGEQKPQFVVWAKDNITREHLVVPMCKLFYKTYLDHHTKNLRCEIASLANHMPGDDHQDWFSELLHKKVNKEKAEQQFQETMQKILDRNWMHRREEIKIKIQSGQCSDDEALDLVKQFDEVKRKQPKLLLSGL